MTKNEKLANEFFAQTWAEQNDLFEAVNRFNNSDLLEDIEENLADITKAVNHLNKVMAEIKK